MASIFLSHNKSDKAFVRGLAQRLSLFGVDAWVDEVEILPGDSLFAKIEDGLNKSDYVGVVLSRNSVNSEWVLREVRAALTQEFSLKDVIVIPLLIEECELPLFLRDKLYADFTKDFFEGFCSLLRRLVIDSELFSNGPNEEIKSWVISRSMPNGLEAFKRYITENTVKREYQKKIKTDALAFIENFGSLSSPQRQDAVSAACRDGRMRNVAHLLNCDIGCRDCQCHLINSTMLARSLIKRAHSVNDIQMLVSIMTKHEGFSDDDQCGRCWHHEYTSSPNFKCTD